MCAFFGLRVSAFLRPSGLRGSDLGIVSLLQQTPVKWGLEELVPSEWCE
jgi:hypothetical protein